MANSLEEEHLCKCRKIDAKEHPHPIDSEANLTNDHSESEAVSLASGFESQGSSPRGGSCWSHSTQSDHEYCEQSDSWEMLSSASTESATILGQSGATSSGFIFQVPSGSSGPVEPYDPIRLIMQGVYVKLVPEESDEPQIHCLDADFYVGSSCSGCPTVASDELGTIGSLLSLSLSEPDPVVHPDSGDRVLIVPTAGT